MSIRNAGAAIREAREKAGLTREKMSDGICSVQSLYRIETGAAGVSPSTFQALMAHAGASCEILPIFANRTDFDCFLALKHIRLHLDAWQLDAAYEELQNVKKMQWASNKYYYQEWLLHHCRLQCRSGKANHEKLKELLLDALHISLPDFNPDNISILLLTINEIELIILLAQEYLYLSDLYSCSLIYKQLSAYLEHSKLSNTEKRRLHENLSIVDIKYLIAVKDYSVALEKALAAREQIIFNQNDGFLLEITFLTGLCYYYNNDTISASDLFKTTVFSAHALKSNYAFICIDFVQKHTTLSIDEDIQSLTPISYPPFLMPARIDWMTLSDGTYDIFSSDVLTFGSLIRTLRTEQKISQNTLCLGLCSKSKLSKIENGTLQPNMLLAEALLQRLGISEREFRFWGNAQEVQIQELKFELIHGYNLPDSERKKLIQQLEFFTKDHNPLIIQIYLYFLSSIEESPENTNTLLKTALSCTLKDFDIDHIHEYRLTWIELVIINRLAISYKPLASSHLGINYLYSLDSYYQHTKMDLLLSVNTHTVMLRLMIHCLYSAGRFNEAIDYFLCRPYNKLVYTISLYTSTLFYACQSFGECGHNDLAHQYGRYAYYLEKLNLFEDSATSLESSLFEDFGINIKQF